MHHHVNREVLGMLKAGVPADEIQNYIRSTEINEYSPVFVDFMQDMIEKYHIKRIYISRITGISQDYLYKILNGSKHTAERDYIIAMCCAIGMNVPETQHALETNRMPLLTDRDIRDQVILVSIEEGVSVHKLNDRLERAGFPWLRVTNDMEQYIPRISMPSETVILKPRIPSVIYRETDRQIRAFHSGSAPFDYTYAGVITVEDTGGRRFFVQGYYSDSFRAFTVMDEENYRIFEKQNDGDYEMMESYSTFNETFDSDFFRFFLEIDRATDEKVNEIMEMLDDTKNYGIRYGCRMTSEGEMTYTERYDSGSPALRQYFQIRRTARETRYTASHDSVFMKLEMGDLYPVYFMDEAEPEYFIDCTSIEETEKSGARIRMIFDETENMMRRHFSQDQSGENETEDTHLARESLEHLRTSAQWAWRSGDVQYAKALNLEAYELADRIEKQSGIDMIGPLMSIMNRISVCCQYLGEKEEAAAWNRRILEGKDALEKAMGSSGMQLDGALGALAQQYVALAAESCEKNDYSMMKKYACRAIELLKDRCSDISHYEILFSACTKAAYACDEDHNPKEAEEYYLAAYDILKRRHLETRECTKKEVLAFYNNYAWMLWNSLHSEEAIIYYGRAIELCEDYMHSSSMDRSELKESLKHYGEALYDLYMQTGKVNESERLKRRLADNGIVLSDKKEQ